MRYLFVLAAIGLPILDIASLIAVGDRIGVWPTVALILLSGLLGAILLRSQGLGIAQQARAALQSGRFPGRAVFDGGCVLIGGALLVLPGFLSDALGLFLLTPPLRGLLLRRLGTIARRSGRFEMFGEAGGRPRPSRASGPVINGEYESIEETAGPIEAEVRSVRGESKRPNSPWQPPAAAVVPPEDP